MNKKQVHASENTHRLILNRNYVHQVYTTPTIESLYICKIQKSKST